MTAQSPRAKKAKVQKQKKIHGTGHGKKIQGDLTNLHNFHEHHNPRPTHRVDNVKGL